MLIGLIGAPINMESLLKSTKQLKKYDIKVNSTNSAECIVSNIIKQLKNPTVKLRRENGR